MLGLSSDQRGLPRPFDVPSIASSSLGDARTSARSSSRHRTSRPPRHPRAQPLNRRRLTIADSTISGNTTTSTIYGGAIYAGYGTFNLSRSTVTDNATGGVRTRFDSDYVRNSTISVNPGIGFFPSRGTANVYNSTIAANADEGIYGFMETVNLVSDVLADAGVTNDINGYSTSFNAGFTLIETPGSNSITTTNPNITGVDPSLGPLVNNGGPTNTHRPSNTSAVLDKGSGTTDDQRNQPRPFDIASIPSAVGGNGADIGAVELQAADLAPPTEHGRAGPGPGAGAGREEEVQEGQEARGGRQEEVQEEEIDSPP